MQISATFHRLAALTVKEFRQLWRDKSSLLVGLGLPLILILIFGYGVNLDVSNLTLAVVSQSSALEADQLTQALRGSTYLTVLQATSLQEAQQWLNAHQVSGIVLIPSDFAPQFYQNSANIQLIINGNSQSASAALQSYVSGALNIWLQKQGYTTTYGVTILSRIWFNAANSSTWYLVPGLIVLIMTLIGAFLTALVMAREWERGTLESLFVTPVRPLEILLAKIIPYFIIGMVGMVMCLISARYLFEVPIQGSVALLIAGGMVYMVVALALGLLISSATKNQFLASQVALLVSFMPAMMLSNFVFDLHNVPTAIQFIGHLLPATYFMELVKTLFLVGDHWQTIIKDSAILLGYAIVLIYFAYRATQKRLD